MDCSKLRPSRERVLIVSHPDGHLEVFAEKNVIVRIERVPVAHSRDAERIAEDFLERSLPPVWRDMYFPGNRRATGTATPLFPSKIRDANQIERLLDSLNGLLEQEQEAEAWMTV